MMVNIYLKTQNDKIPGNKIGIVEGSLENLDAVYDVLNSYWEGKGIKPFLYRSWIVHHNGIYYKKIDFGSHFEFIYIEEVKE